MTSTAILRKAAETPRAILPEHGDGEQIYKKWVVPAVVTMDKVVGHYAVSALFENYGDKTTNLLL